MNYVKKFVIAILGAFIGYLFCYFVIAEIYAIYFPGNVIFYLMILGTCIVGGAMLLNVIINKSVSHKIFMLISVAYICILLAILFYRQTLEPVFIFNPFKDLDSLATPENLFQSALNLMIFIPLGYAFKEKKMVKCLGTSFVLALGIELIQGFACLGFFDVLDIIMYIAGIMLGRLIFKHWEIEVVS